MNICMFVALAGMTVCFFMGILVGLACRSKPLKPVEPEVSDAARRRKFEADQKALQDCLSYSIDVAYQTDGE